MRTSAERGEGGILNARRDDDDRRARARHFRGGKAFRFEERGAAEDGEEAEQFFHDILPAKDVFRKHNTSPAFVKSRFLQFRAGVLYFPL